ncbi:MAG: tagaturonate epimerase family protein, partial [Anaerolineales bacterium]|nr:tagaturonate epimerase family protein [Anaerolineales bacterium]
NFAAGQLGIAPEVVYFIEPEGHIVTRFVNGKRLAPRYVGRFEKGVDYIGDLAAFEADFAGHAAIARQFGPYKLSLHSGSDKFSIYPIATHLAHGLVHLKTAGTSYLEALRTIAALDSDLFREIYAFARECYEHDRASYHVSAELKHAPLPVSVTDWPGLLEQLDAREILHVTFGSVLTEKAADGQKRFYERLISALRANPESYAANLERHFIRHLQPFITPD